MKDTIIAVIRTLDSISVKGSDNMNKLLGCIQALQKLLREIPEEKTGENKDGR